MKPYLTILLLFVTGLALAQDPVLIPGKLRKPTVNSARTLNLDNEGFPVLTPKAGASERIRIDPTVNRVTSFYSLSAIQTATTSLSLAPSVITLTDAGRSGTYRLRVGDSSTPDNGGTILTTAGGLRYELQHNGEVSITQFGVKYDDFASAASNVTALNQAIASGVKLIAPEGHLYTAGSVTATAGSVINLRGLNTVFDHITDNTLFDFSAGVSGTISGISINAGIGMSSGSTALKIKTVAGRLPSITVRDVKIARMGGLLEWGKGLMIIDPDEAVFENMVISGINSANMRAVEITNTRPAVSTTFRNVKIYDAHTGFYLRNSTNRGIEGMRFLGCDAVGVDRAWDCESTVSDTEYIPPQIIIDGAHLNAFSYGIKLKNYIQVIISNGDFYLQPNSEQTAYGIYGESVSQIKIHHTDVYNNGAGQAYGVVLGGAGTVQATVNNMNIVMGSASSGNPAVLLGGTVSGALVENIWRTGGNATVTNLGTNNVVGRTFNGTTLETP